MERPFIKLPAKQTLLLILVPMLLTFLCQRLYLHLIGVTHVHPAGFLVHHLFFGVLIELPAAFVLAFGTRKYWLALAAPAALGIGSAMILDEMIYLIATKATDADYVSNLSLGGAIVFMALAVMLLVALYLRHRDVKEARDV
jgi:hypothetical protein